MVRACGALSKSMKKVDPSRDKNTHVFPYKHHQTLSMGLSVDLTMVHQRIGFSRTRYTVNGVSKTRLPWLLKEQRMILM